MIGHFNFSPFTDNHSFGINKESASLNAHVFATVHFLEFHHVVESAKCLVAIANQREGEALLGAKILMAFQTIT